jgi:hypothetical protein
VNAADHNGMITPRVRHVGTSVVVLILLATTVVRDAFAISPTRANSLTVVAQSPPTGATGRSRSVRLTMSGTGFSCTDVGIGAVVGLAFAMLIVGGSAGLLTASLAGDNGASSKEPPNRFRVKPV